MANVKGNLDGLNKLIKMLKDDYTLRVGILGSRARSQHGSNSSITNAELGAVHEFGATINVTDKMRGWFYHHGVQKSNNAIEIPARSFLWMPLTEKLNFNNPKMQGLKKVIWKQLFVKKAPEEFYRTLGAMALDAIGWAFQTNGGGMWKPLSGFTEKQFSRRRKKGLPQILTDTGKLRRSMSFKILKGGQG